MKALTVINLIVTVTFLVLFLSILSHPDTFTLDEFEPFGVTFGVWSVVYAIIQMSKTFRKR